MDTSNIQKSFDFSGKVAAVTGGAGMLCATICKALAAAGAKVAVLDLNIEVAKSLAGEICAQGGEAIAVPCNVVDKESLEAAAREVMSKYNHVDLLINGAGGNKATATTTSEQSFFDIPAEALRWVYELNLMGTILSSQVFGKLLAGQKSGVILNVSSMNAYRPLTRIAAYSAAKAGVANFTQWLAVHLAQEVSTSIRVNAIAPGFFLTEQNRYLLVDKETGEATPRGRSIIAHTPMGRFGAPDDLLGTVFWLLSSASEFVTGIVVPVDGGFSAFSGV